MAEPTLQQLLTRIEILERHVKDLELFMTRAGLRILLTKDPVAALKRFIRVHE